jgi:hypothetical protein
MSVVKNLKGQFSLPLSALQVFNATCPKLKSDFSIQLNDAMKAELQHADGAKRISFYEETVRGCPPHEREYATTAFGYPKPVPPKLMPSWRSLGVSPTIYLLHSLARMFS